MLPNIVRVAVLAACVAMPVAAVAESALETVVVTGSRLSEYDAAVIPHVVLKRRADNIIMSVRVACDTRDKDQRLAEMKETLRGLMRSAAGKNITLGVTTDDIVRDLTERMFDDLITPDSRPDTSALSVVVKTTVTESDTLDSATDRIRDFIAKARRVGRTEVNVLGRPDLTLLSPERNRDELMQRIVDDAKRTAALIGPSTGIGIEGLQRPIEWYRSGPLELALYIPYKLEIAPK